MTTWEDRLLIALIVICTVGSLMMAARTVVLMHS